MDALQAGERKFVSCRGQADAQQARLKPGIRLPNLARWRPLSQTAGVWLSMSLETHAAARVEGYRIESETIN